MKALREPGRRSSAAAWRVRGCVARGAWSEAARCALDEYGAELFGFLIGALDDDVDAARFVYAEVGRRVGAEISEFSWKCPIRVWLYAVARRELRARRRPGPRRDSAPPDEVALGRLPLSGVGMGDVLALRRSLPEEDREILILHVDRGLEWRELAWTSLGDRASDVAIAGEARSLRGRMLEIQDRIEAALRRRNGHPR